MFVCARLSISTSANSKLFLSLAKWLQKDRFTLFQPVLNQYLHDHYSWAITRIISLLLYETSYRHRFRVLYHDMTQLLSSPALKGCIIVKWCCTCYNTCLYPFLIVLMLWECTKCYSYNVVARLILRYLVKNKLNIWFCLPVWAFLKWNRYVFPFIGIHNKSEWGIFWAETHPPSFMQIGLIFADKPTNK